MEAPVKPGAFLFMVPADGISWHRLLRRNHFIVRFNGRLFRPG